MALSLQATYAGYDLQDSIGPIAYPADLSIAAWKDVPIPGSLLTLARYENNNFQALAAAVTLL